MSEAIPGLPPPPEPPPIRLAAVALAWRPTATGVEVFWIKRDKGLTFGGGYYAFPAGKHDAADAHVPVEGATGELAALTVTAARELFEETGLLVATGAERLSQSTLEEARKALLGGTRTFAHIVNALGLTLRAVDFVPAGRWLTPPFMPVRFDARTFLVRAPAQQTAEVWPGELSEGAWVTAAEGLARWQAGTALLHPPNLHALRVFSHFTTPAAAARELSAPPDVVDFVGKRIEFQRGIQVVPLRTATLPPATHTNCYLLGTRELLIVDPGSDAPGELQVLLERIQQRVTEGCTVKAVVLTHHHSDHISGLVPLVKALGVPVWAHALTATRCPLPVARVLAERDTLELLGDSAPMHFEVLHTPGHARGHVVLIEKHSRAAIVGDMVAGVGTIVIDPPEGDMGEYLRQLERLKPLVGALYPSHGPIIAFGAGKLDEYLAHRAWREAKVINALNSLGKPAALEDIVPLAYDDVVAFVWPLAERNTAAILGKLETEGRVKRESDRYAITPP